MNMDKKLIAKAKEAKNVEELLMAAKESGMELSKEQAEEYFAQIKKLSDDELEAVAGGVRLPSKQVLDKYSDLIIGFKKRPSRP